MRNWQKIRLGDICTLNYGKALTATKRVAGDIPVYSSAGITGWHNKSLLDSRSIIIGRKGTVGSVYLCGTPFWCIDTAYYILPKDDVYNFKYLYYRLCSLGLNKLNEDSAVPGLNRDTAYNQEFDLPPLEEQERIAKILGSLDDKIELNNKINRNLEAQAEALFKQWFVDFDFPDPSGNPYRTSGGAMIDSPMGTIPEWWRVKSAEDIFNISIGKTPPRKEQHWFTKNKSDVKWVSIADMGKSGTFINDSSEYLTDEAVQKYNVAIVPNNTVILSFKLTIGRVAITDGAITTNEAIAHFKTANEDIVEYLYLNLKQYNYESLGNTSSIATAVNSKTIKSMKLILPSNEVLTAFSFVTTPIFEMLKKNNKQTQVLTYLRDSLLPKLMNNEINL